MASSLSPLGFDFFGSATDPTDLRGVLNILERRTLPISQFLVGILRDAEKAQQAFDIARKRALAASGEKDLVEYYSAVRIEKVVEAEFRAVQLAFHEALRTIGGLHWEVSNELHDRHYRLEGQEFDLDSSSGKAFFRWTVRAVGSGEQCRSIFGHFRIFERAR